MRLSYEEIEQVKTLEKWLETAAINDEIEIDDNRVYVYTGNPGHVSLWTVGVRSWSTKPILHKRNTRYKYPR